MTKASGVLARSAIAQENTPYQTTEVERWAALNPGLGGASSRLQSWIRPDAKKTAGQ
jgi:hypothetical protein